MELLKRRASTVPYALRQVQTAQERVRLKAQVTSVRKIKEPVQIKETIVTANSMELKTISSVRKLG